MGPASGRARHLAERRGLPYLALEDGFIRSLGPASAGFATMSLIVDPVGIYYDATRPSALEDMLDAALDEHPDAAVLVKLPPEVAAGRKEGYLDERARRLGITTWVHDVNPVSLV